ncbi:MAG: TIGR01212 family radical SAM protein [Muribaculaceae bacterium]|nr:TIGR01212 family radical SAM protein [Muribaculaceae bacterium]
MQKLSVNAGLSCPNRDGTTGRGGCSYCNNQSFSPGYTASVADVVDQLEAGKRFFARKYPEMKYLAYFQSYTGTHGEIDHLTDLYRRALAVDDVEGLIVATRPDCLPPALVDRLAEIARERYLMIELGAESSHDVTLTRVNRCHTWADTVDAVTRLHDAGIAVGLHLIMGLPGETTAMMLATIDAVNRLPVATVKLHQLQLIAGTPLARDVEAGREEVAIFEVDDYIDLCCNVIDRLRDDIAIERFVSQSPDNLLIAPRWGLKNYQFVDRLRAALRARK